MKNKIIIINKKNAFTESWIHVNWVKISITCGYAAINQKNHQKTVQKVISLQVFFQENNWKNHLKIKSDVINGIIIL